MKVLLINVENFLMNVRICSSNEKSEGVGAKYYVLSEIGNVIQK